MKNTFLVLWSLFLCAVCCAFQKQGVRTHKKSNPANSKSPKTSVQQNREYPYTDSLTGYYRKDYTKRKPVVYPFKFQVVNLAIEKIVFNFPTEISIRGKMEQVPKDTMIGFCVDAFIPYTVDTSKLNIKFVRLHGDTFEIKRYFWD